MIKDIETSVEEKKTLLCSKEEMFVKRYHYCVGFFFYLGQSSSKKEKPQKIPKGGIKQVPI